MKGRAELILDGLSGQNEPAEFEGRKGFWCQGDCIFIEAKNPSSAVAKYHQTLVAVSHNHFCGSIVREKERVKVEQCKQWLESILKDPSQSQSLKLELGAFLKTL